MGVRDEALRALENQDWSDAVVDDARPRRRWSSRPGCRSTCSNGWWPPPRSGGSSPVCWCGSSWNRDSARPASAGSPPSSWTGHAPSLTRPPSARAVRRFARVVKRAVLGGKYPTRKPGQDTRLPAPVAGPPPPGQTTRQLKREALGQGRPEMDADGRSRRTYKRGIERDRRAIPGPSGP